ncbi:hypothetical protein E1286_42580 [Nonomuraea terrae]|uniref:SRPBCC family protein n=1 Tax=Nonomuraea terrae TaxID=2530383 RepID=A0A4R4XPB3_9ACTN|nr:SRPBCC family protein [Nonomuraea terrae]TDD33198.1 hypothetical protein E1286_42580 [Nonomuraea terrae]
MTRRDDAGRHGGTARSGRAETAAASMFVLEATAEMPRPAEKVWFVVADYALDRRWRSGVISAKSDPPGPVTPGSTIDEVMRIAGRPYRSSGIVTEVGPGMRFSWRNTKGSDSDGERRVEPLDGERCTVTMVVRVRLRGAERLLAPFVAPMLRRTLRQDVRRLRAVIMES